MKAIQFLIGFALFALASSLASAYDPALFKISVWPSLITRMVVLFVNGKFCKDPKLAKAEDFFLSGLDKPGNTENRLGFNVTNANVEQIPGLNTLGTSAVRIDYAPYGQNPPHTHPRATEILVVLEGTLYVGFVTSNQLNNTLIAKVLNKGDVFVFPIGLIHFQVNIGNKSAVAFAGFSSQFPGVITIADTVFGANPPINPDFLGKAFQLDPKIVKDLQDKFINGN
ncbi:Germin-like protein subfamily 1 member 14 [Citrus sinensis]|uniref:Germin-like protein subfamily 1 member 14 n=1 Tax=Citrus sinensis TaxID=2711 RepID=A0ACB8MED3_CITSI|nr:Germin-like protein subfamily 1 member 14 [Citrus sinensis]